MLLRERPVPEEYKIMQVLNLRMKLCEDDKFRIQRLKKGYEGEVQFDLLAKNIKEERYIINDLLLEHNGNYFQIDTVIIEQSITRLLDVKNYEDDYRLEEKVLYKGLSETPCQNPIDSLNRSVTLFSQMLQKYKLDIPVSASLIFVNPKFTLYQAPMDLPIIFPGQLETFIEKINIKRSKLTEKDNEFAKFLLSLHQKKNPKIIYPEYEYGRLKKGVYCIYCDSFDVSVDNHDLVCNKCNGREKVQSSVLRNVYEIKLLFPEEKITTSKVFEWCNEVFSRKVIRRVLKKNFKNIGERNVRYFE